MDMVIRAVFLGSNSCSSSGRTFGYEFTWPGFESSGFCFFFKNDFKLFRGELKSPLILSLCHQATSPEECSNEDCMILVGAIALNQ